MSRRGKGLLLICCLAVAAAAAHGQPRDLHLENDHWTAWQPPAVPEGVDVYTVQRGDSLWSLAARFLGDPYLWPLIWENNQYVLDSHWIYPGDPLIIPGVASSAGEERFAGAPLDEAAMSPVDELLEGQDGMADFLDGLGSRNADGPVPLGYSSDIYCSGFISEAPLEDFPYRIVSSEYEFLTPTLNPERDSEIQGIYGKSDTQKFGLGLGDIVYLDSGRADGLSPGELLTALQPLEKVSHPLKKESLGRFYKRLGRVRVLSVQDDSAIAEIVLSCYPIPVGSNLALFEPEPVPLRRRTPMRPVNYPAAEEELAEGGSIIYANDNVVALGSGSVVYIDRGEAQDVAPGDVFTIYRRGRRGFPPIVLGELGVLSVQGKTSLARILYSRYAIYIGDALLLK